MSIEPKVAAREQSCKSLCGGLRGGKVGESEKDSNEESRKKAENTTNVECGKGVVQSLSDEEAGKREKDIDAYKAARENVEVVEEDEKYGEGSQAVKVATVAHGGMIFYRQ